MKSKAEVAEALKRLVRTLKPFPVGFEGSHLGNAVAEVADALCGEPEPKTDDLCDEPGPKRAEGPLAERIWASWGEMNRTLRQGMALAWQEGYDRRDKREPGGTANNPYHEQYQGLRPAVVRPASEAPESWQEERAAILAENAQLRDLNKAHRGDLASVLIRPNDTGWKTLLEEVAILLETSRANERNAREAREALQMVSSSPETIGRMVSAIGRAAEKEGERHAIQKDIRPGLWADVEFAATVPVGSPMCVSRKIALSFPEDCAGQQVKIKVTKLA